MNKIKFRAWCEEDKVMVYDLNSTRLHHGELKDEMYKFMQFTGIQDKNGTDIYECDILKNIPYHKEKPELVIVNFTKFDKCGGCPHQTWGMGFDVGEYESDHLEIIGNIHENKDLLC